MLRNYLTTAWRNIWKTRTFSILNVSGLALGIAAFLLILCYLRFQYSFDDFNVNKDRIYRVPMEVVERGAVSTQADAFTFPAVAGALKRDFPQIEETVRFRKQWGIVRHGDNKYSEDGLFLFADPAVLRIFTFDFERGVPQQAFAQPSDIIITESTAKKYFGDENPINQTLSFHNEDYIVSAVIKDLPANSHLHFDILGNFNKYAADVRKQQQRDVETSWQWSDFYTYILLKPGTDVNRIRKALPDFAQRYMGTLMKKEGFTVNFHLQALKDIHLHSSYDYEFPGNGNFSYLRYLAFAAVFILLIAWINYINLSTARAIDRAKEVGIRKVVGAGRAQLIRQFMTESSLINAMATAGGALIYWFSLPNFAVLVGFDKDSLALPPEVLAGTTFAVFIIGSVLAGSYPSFVLSSFKPLGNLKPVTPRSGRLRQSLVVLQFFIAILLIAGALGFYRQLRFMSHADLGLDTRQTLILHNSLNQDSSQNKLQLAFVHGLMTTPGVQSVTMSSSIPGQEVGGSSGYKTEHSETMKTLRGYGIDELFFKDYDLTVSAGRGFTPADKEGPLVVLNEAAARVLGFQKDEDAINQKINDTYNTYQVIGVIRDFHQKSMQSEIDPIAFFLEPPYNLGYFSVKINTPDPQSLIKTIHRQWTSAFPDSPFEYRFLDDIFDAQYKNDRVFSAVLWLFTLLGIVLAGLGLLGLSFHTVSKRGKEISIRKVLGASSIQIFGLITRDYFYLIGIAALGAIPTAWFVISDWLKSYPFHISIGAWFVVVPLGLIVGIAMGTVLYHSLRASLENPITRLKSE
jgi:putative ABC transport system permease protein